MDWDDAAALAGRLAPPGPVLGRAEMADLVGSLRAAAHRAVEPVADITGLRPPDDAPPGGTATVLVVDRPGWARSMAGLTEDALALPDGRSVPLAAELVGSAEVGGALAALATKVLGQLDPYAPEAGRGSPGRLLLVAPNVLRTERDLRVRPADFRLWVCLHEQTHALQLTAAPWLSGHLRDRTRGVLADLSGAPGGVRALAGRVRAAATGTWGAVRGRDGASVLDGMLDGDQRSRLDEVTAVMALLEGHADVAMDAVGPAVVPTVRTIRRRFEQRRAEPGTRDGLVRRLLGMDAKLAQYRDGARFVRAVTRQVGTDGFNAVWTGPGALPSAREIADPDAWVRRVHG
ncbi:zinc-dependent metalloprotease [Sanguibacter suaedae]|uniref:zinc-dependent metalloprotease n=1 Tax=Sanguibacter suaedae TaxID=2795737 RepID=UPI0027DDB0F2|nr:zinc-dependent metalloprotease [Sanguibacter suaedae]